MKKHGVENFELTFLEEDIIEEVAFELEQRYTDEWNTLSPHGYNLCRGGRGGSTHSDETRRKISENTRRGMTPEVRAKFSATRTGRKLSDERRAQMSEAMKGNRRGAGRVVSPETRAKLAASSRKAMTPEVRAKISEKMKGNKNGARHDAPPNEGAQ
jgi:hypothetical protein